ncbi:splicing factor, CC1-like protein [Artemisia annua]|uniref:Splicing factor, CC1-like protein n=1 Tax=Artemisia annua TaxID=35608 RepID=A0A2U1L6G1_ARTAN|nr:splicing factor, CC1-like protein [Artemisia annua]
MGNLENVYLCSKPHEEDDTKGGTLVYAGNLHPEVTKDALHQLFEIYTRGAVVEVILPTDANGNRLDYGFIQFEQLQHARVAQKLNGQLRVKGLLMKVSTVTEEAWLKPMEAKK